MTTITIERSLLEKLYLYWIHDVGPDELDDFNDEVRAALAAPATAPEQPASKALQDVATERQRQDAKWGGPEHDDLHSFADWRRFINNRLASSAYVSDSRTRKFWIEIAALAIAAAESIDRKGNHDHYHH